MEKKTLIIAVVAVLAIIGATVRLVTSNSESTSRGNPKPFELLGASAAEEVAKLLNGNGKVVVVMETLEGTKNPNNEAQVKGFKSGLAKNKGVTLKEVKEIKRDMSGDPRLWPEGQAAQIVSLGEGAGALVLFFNLPQTLPPKDIATLKGSKAKILMVGTQSPVVDSLVAGGVIQVAIVGRTPPKPAPGGTETPAQWFGRVYTVLKAQ